MSREPSKAEKTRSFIIERTAEVFNKKGYAGTSLSDLTSATGLTKGSIYGNFQNKEEVALAVFEYNCSRIARMTGDEVARAGSYHDKLMAYAQVYKKVIRDTATRGGCPILNTAIEADDTNPALREQVARVIHRWEKNISSLIQGGVDAGEFKKDTNAKTLSLSIIALIEGGVMISKATGESGKMDHILSTVEFLISGIRK